MAPNMLPWPTLSKNSGSADMKTLTKSSFTYMGAIFSSCSLESVLEMMIWRLFANLNRYLSKNAQLFCQNIYYTIGCNKNIF